MTEETLVERPTGNEYLHPEANAEWWYFDAQTPDGLAANIIFYSHLGKNKPTFSLFLHAPGKPPVAIHEMLDEEFVSSPEQYLSLGSSSVIKNQGKFRLESSGDRHLLNLDFDPDYEPQQLDIQQQGMNWRVEAPKAAVIGKITIDSKEYDFSGTGYHDHNWFLDESLNRNLDNREILAKVLGGWQFGRFFTPEADIVYGFNKSESHLLLNGVEIHGDILKTDLVPYKRFNCEYPGVITVTSETLQAMISNERILTANALVEQNDRVENGYLRFQSKVRINQSPLKQIGIHEVWT